MKTAIITLLLLIAMITPAAAQNVVVISNGGAGTISKADLGQCFLGKKSSVGGAKVVIATQKSGDAHAAFLKTYLAKLPDQYSMYWKQLVFTGQGTMPQSFASDADLIAFVGKTPGAIGYISPASKGGLPGNVKVVAVQ